MRLDAFVWGHVQGVGYRQFVRRTLGGLGLRGGAVNLSDGRVHVWAVGSQNAIHSLVKALKIGPVHSDVQGVEVKFTDSGDLSYS